MKHVVILLLCVLAGPLWAAEDHDAARDAVRRNQVIPLSDIIPDVLQRFDARLLEVEFEREDGQFIYELELITGSGRMIEVMVDAASGELLGVDQEGWQANGPERDD